MMTMAPATIPVRTVVFDFGAVLFRWEPARLLQQVLPQRVADEAAARALTAQFFQSFVPGSDWAEFDRGRLGIEQLVPRLAARLRLPAQEVRAVIDAVPAHLSPKPDSVAWLRRLHAQGLRLCFLSNMPAPFAAHLDAAHPDILSCFDGGVYSAHVGHVKPEPAVFRATEQRCGLVPALTAFIDDHPGNVEAASACGWHGLHFTDAASCAAALDRWLALPAAAAA